MSRVITLSALACASCCTAVCSPVVEVHLIGPNGAAVQPTTGTATISGLAIAFDCTVDGGTPPATCAGSTLHFAGDHWTTTMGLAVRDAEGHTFSDFVPLDYFPTGRDVCESVCLSANPIVALL